MSFKMYKRGQGINTRLWSGLVCFTITAIGCFRLYQILLSRTNNAWLYTFAPLGVCAAIALLIFWLVNKPNVADFMIAAEGEIKKVSWSSRREIVASTTIVIGVVLSMGVMLVGVDFVFRSLFEFVLKLYE